MNPVSGPSRVLLIASPEDDGALRVARALRSRRDVESLLLSTEQLLLAPHWVHDPLGDTEIRLGNGEILSNDTIGAVLCRIRCVDPPQFVRARPRDRVYAQAEFYSLILSWLAQLGVRVHNPPHAGNLSGIRVPPLEDRLRFATRYGRGVPCALSTGARQLKRGAGVLAAFRPGEDEPALAGRDFAPLSEFELAGGPAMRLPDRRGSPPLRLTVVGGEVFGSAPAGFAAAAARLVRQRGLSVAEVRMTQLADGRWGGCSIEPDADIESADIAEAVAKLLCRTVRQMPEEVEP